MVPIRPSKVPKRAGGLYSYSRLCYQLVLRLTTYLGLSALNLYVYKTDTLRGSFSTLKSILVLKIKILLENLKELKLDTH